mmetsp:Transcript_23249/g.48284  ORF Transcript_23249/g.48284 Transcript_23249/m.48284 type:complete len:205 (-) Transcript_23249:10819-11433(-)
MLILVSLAVMSFWLTSVAFALVLARTSMSSSSSNRFPVLALSLSKRSWSSFSNALVFAFTSFMTSVSCSSRLFCSFPMTLPRSCSSSPLWVTVKSTIVVLAWSSGLKWGLGSLVVMYKKNSFTYSQGLSPTIIYMLLALRIIAFSRTGVNIESSSFSTLAIIKAFPSHMQYSSCSLSFEFVNVVVPKFGSLSFSCSLIHASAWP